MKVLDVYNKDDLDLITYNGIEISTMMEGFFSKFPLSYRRNYDRNLETLEIHRVDEMPSEFDSAQYYPNSNILLFKSFAAIPHELIHMASFDKVNRRFAICRDGEYSLFENALVEGMTEYLSCVAKNGYPNTYFFEWFVVSLLSNIDGLFEPFFIPDYNKFISLFPNKRDICSLMYGLDFYHNGIGIIDDNSTDIELERIRGAIRSVIDSLIDIEMSFKRSKRDRKIYGDKFMDLIVNPDICGIVGDVYSEYVDYAYCEVKKRVLGRNR